MPLLCLERMPTATKRAGSYPAATLGVPSQLSNAFSLTALCYVFLPSTGLAPKTTFTAFFIVQLPWLPLLYYMFSVGIMGFMGIAQFGTFSAVATALSIYTYLKL